MRTGVTPVPIPNTLVKTCAAENTMLETAWEDRWLPDSLLRICKANFNKQINRDVLTRLIKKQENWGRSSVGRAPALQAGGQEFESLRLHLVSVLDTVEH